MGEGGEGDGEGTQGGGKWEERNKRRVPISMYMYMHLRPGKLQFYSLASVPACPLVSLLQAEFERCGTKFGVR